MHSRLYQVSDQPIDKEELTHEYDYYDGFVGQVADYISERDEEKIKADIDWLGGQAGINVNSDKRTFVITSKTEYFSKKYDKFKEVLEKLSTFTLEDFVSPNNWLDFYNLENACEEKYGFYVDDCGWTTLDSWVRNAEENKTYHIGSTFDYHF